MSQTNPIKYSKKSIERAKQVRLMHEILGHPSDGVLQNMLNNGNILNCKFTAKDVRECTDILGVCIGCVLGKMTKKPMRISPESNKEIGELIHVDLFEIEQGDRYLISVDDKSGYIISVKMESKTTEKYIECDK